VNAMQLQVQQQQLELLIDWFHDKISIFENLFLNFNFAPTTTCTSCSKYNFVWRFIRWINLIFLLLLGLLLCQQWMHTECDSCSFSIQIISVWNLFGGKWKMIMCYSLYLPLHSSSLEHPQFSSSSMLRREVDKEEEVHSKTFPVMLHHEDFLNLNKIQFFFVQNKLSSL
jgi:hypothetical protein